MCVICLGWAQRLSDFSLYDYVMYEREIFSNTCCVMYVHLVFTKRIQKSLVWALTVPLRTESAGTSETGSAVHLGEIEWHQGCVEAWRDERGCPSIAAGDERRVSEPIKPPEQPTRVSQPYVVVEE